MYNPYQNNGYPNNYGYGYQTPPTQPHNGMQYPNTGAYYQQQQQQPPAAYPTQGYAGTAVQPSYQPGFGYPTTQYGDYQNYNNNNYNQHNAYNNNQSNTNYYQNPISIDPNAYTSNLPSYGAPIPTNNYNAPSLSYPPPVNAYAPPAAVPVSYNAAETNHEQHIPTAPSHEPIRTPSGSSLQATPEAAPTPTPTAPVETPTPVTGTSTSTPPTSTSTSTPPTQTETTVAPVPVVSKQSPPKEQPTPTKAPTASTENTPIDKSPSPQEPNKPKEVSTIPRPKVAKGAPKQQPQVGSSGQTPPPATGGYPKIQSLNEKLERLQAAKLAAVANSAETVQSEKQTTADAPNLPTLPLDSIERSKLVLNKSPSFATAKPRATTASNASPVRSESARLPIGAKSTSSLPNSERAPAPKQISKELEFPWAKAQGVYGSWTSNRKALVVACAYKGNRLGAELSHSLAYVTKVYNMLINVYQFDIGSITVFTDEDNSNPATIPTKNNIKQGMQWLLWQAKPGDSLFFYFFGHGGMQPLLNIEAEGILPSDYEIAGYFKGRELRQALVEPLPLGAKISLVFDCFHCGISLPKTISGAPQEEAVGKNKKDKKKDKKIKKSSKAPSTSELIARAAEAETGFVSLFSVTKPFGQQNLRPGYLTDAFSSSISSHKGISYVDLLSKIAEHMTVLEAEVTPELSSNTEVEIHQPVNI